MRATPLQPSVGACSRASCQWAVKCRSCNYPVRRSRRSVVGCAAQQALPPAARPEQVAVPGRLRRRSTLLAALQTAAAVLARPVMAEVEVSWAGGKSNSWGCPMLDSSCAVKGGGAIASGDSGPVA